MFDTVVNVVLGITAAAWMIAAVWGLRAVLALRRLPPCDSPANTALPRVSVIVPARDEAARIETSIRRLFAQTGVDLEVIAVDDRSTDGTGTILKKLAAEDARLTPVHIDAVPEGWLGKCYACQVGSRYATSDWLLFSDADVWLQPDVIARAVKAAEDEQADHVCLTFTGRHASLAGKACQLYLALAVATDGYGVNRDRPRAYMGIGAFNLISRRAYRAGGGYQPLRLSVVDDVKLGLLVRRAGFRSRVYFGGTDVDADWAVSPWGLVRVLAKTHFAMVGYSYARAFAVALFLAVMRLP